MLIALRVCQLGADGDDITPDEAHVTSHRATTKPLRSSPRFLAHTTYTTTVVVRGVTIDYLAAGRPVTCAARVPGSPTRGHRTSSFVHVFPGCKTTPVRSEIKN